MGVARQAATLAASGFVCELKAEGEEEGEDEFNKGFGGAQERKVGRLITEVDGDRAVVTYRFGGVSHVSSPGQMPLARMRHGEGNVLKDQAYCERLGSSPLRGYPETLSFHRHKLMQHPCGNETQGDRKERVGSA